MESSLKLLDAAALEELNRKVKQLERDMDKVIAKKQPYADLSGLEQRKRIGTAIGREERKPTPACE